MRLVEADEVKEKILDIATYSTHEGILLLSDVLHKIDECQTLDIGGRETEWIPVKERMPEERDSIFAKFKGDPRWTNTMFKKVSDTCIITIDYENQKLTIPAHTVDGKWSARMLDIFQGAEVIAWMPLPEPYGGERVD